jgi:hypothetical protein
MDLNDIRKSPIFLGQVTNYSPRNRPYEASRRGLARGQVISISPSLERIRKNWGGQGFLTLDNYSLINYKITKAKKMDVGAKRMFDYYYLQAIHLCA